MADANGHGEINVGENSGSAGVGLYRTKDGVKLQFYKIASADGLLTIELVDDDYVRMTLNESLLDLANFTGTLPVAHGGTGATDAAGARTNLGAAADDHDHDSDYAAIVHNHDSDYQSIDSDAVAGNLAEFDANGEAIDSGIAVIDEDDMSTDSAAHVPTQQSVKAYVDTAVAGAGSAPRLAKVLCSGEDPEEYAAAPVIDQDSGSGQAKITNSGWDITTGSTAGSSSACRVSCHHLSEGVDWDNNPEMMIHLRFYNAMGDRSVAQWVMGNNGSWPTSQRVMTAKHAGFIFGWYGGGAPVLSASNADGASQTLTTVAGYTQTNGTAFRTTMTSGTDIKFYKNGVLVATHTTNLPTGAMSSVTDIGADLDAGITDTASIAVNGCSISVEV